MSAVIIDADCLEEELCSKPLASEDDHFPEENSCPLYVLGVSQSHYLCDDHISCNLVFKLLFVLLFKCEMYDYA